MKQTWPISGGLIVVALVVVATLSLGCTKDRDNPLDPGAGGTDPFGLQVSSTVQGVQVQWQKIAGAGVAGYRVYRSTDSADPGIVVGSAGSAGRSCTDSTGYNGTTYWYRVAAVDTKGQESVMSAAAAVTVEGARLFVTPTVWSPGSDSANTVVTIRSDSTKCRFDYTLTCQAGWLTITESLWGSVRLSVSANGTATERTASVVVTAAGVASAPDTVRVTQPSAGQNIWLELDSTQWRAPGLGGSSGNIWVKSYGTGARLFCVVTVSSLDASWLGVSSDTGTTPFGITVTAEDNFTDNPRDGMVVVIANNAIPDTLFVHQPKMAWQVLGTGLNSPGRALTVFDGKLIAGGTFTTAGGVAANKIASWDGGSWSPVGSGADDVVEALTVYDGKLLAGGCFVTAGGEVVNRIALWDGSGWSALGSGMGGYFPYVFALTSFNGQLIAGGRFSTAGEAAACNIASWDGSNWSPLGLGIADVQYRAVYALSLYNGELIAGGNFDTAGGAAANRIASWDGSSWSPLGSGMNWGIKALTVYDGKLIAGGFFWTAGGVTANYIASWDGSNWSSLGSGMGGGINPSVYALAVYDGKLIAGGFFETAGGVAANCIASWDGSGWSSLGSGMGNESNPGVIALTVYDGRLVAVGQFTVAGGQRVNQIACFAEKE